MGLDMNGGKHAMVRWKGNYTESSLLKWNDLRITKAHKDDFARRQAERRRLKLDIHGKLHRHTKTEKDSTDRLSRPDDRALDPGVTNFKKNSGKSTEEYAQWKLQHPTLRQTLQYNKEHKELTGTESIQKWANNSMIKNWFDASTQGVECRGTGMPAKEFIKIIQHEVQTCPTLTQGLQNMIEWATRHIATFQRHWTETVGHLQFMSRS